MIEFLGLPKLGDRIRAVDRHLVEVIAHRRKLALQVGAEKQADQAKIVRTEIEERRLDQVRAWAAQKGLNPDFAHALFYLIIDESCKTQTEQLQDHPELKRLAGMPEKTWYRMLRQNLLDLTMAIAAEYDQRYDEAYYATRCYLNFEQELLAATIERLTSRKLAVDLGCATGRIALQLAPKFEQVVGFDLSPAMVNQVLIKRDQLAAVNVTVRVADIEEGIPLADQTVSLAVMNLGTASDIRPMKQFLAEVWRVLEPGGTVFFSFYNADALVYRVGFLPWPLGLAAEINLEKHCLDVHHVKSRKEPYSIYARAYRTSEVKELFDQGWRCGSLMTFPIMCSILPPYIFDDPAIRQTMTEFDKSLTNSNFGAYIIAVASKI